MYDIYNIARGTLAWAAFLIFIGGCIYRIADLLLEARKKDRIVFSYFSPYHALRSLYHWVVPFASVNMRNHPVFTTVAFVFHVALLAVPIFLLAHVILVKESWNVSWWYMPDAAADILTAAVVIACGFFLVRRLTLPDVRYLTSASDYVLLLLVAAPFMTGFWASHRWYGFEVAAILHMLTGELLLVAIPFTRLSHMLFFPFTRGYAGSEFGAVRHARDW